MHIVGRDACKHDNDCQLDWSAMQGRFLFVCSIKMHSAANIFLPASDKFDLKS